MQDAIKNTGDARLYHYYRTEHPQLWSYLEGLSIEPFNTSAAIDWLKKYPGGSSKNSVLFISRFIHRG
jgi:predicted choloylglycine hydrolase